MLIIPFNVSINKNNISAKDDMNINTCHLLYYLSTYLKKEIDYSSMPVDFVILLSIWQDRFDIFKKHIGNKINNRREVIKELNKKEDKRWLYFVNSPSLHIPIISKWIEGPIGISKWKKGERSIILLHDCHTFPLNNVKATHVNDYLLSLQDHDVHIEMPLLKDMQNVQGYLQHCLSSPFFFSDRRFTKFYYNLYNKQVIGNIDEKEDLQHLPLIPSKYHRVLLTKYEKYKNKILNHKGQPSDLIPLISFNSLICDIYLLSLLFTTNNNLVYYFGHYHCIFLRSYLMAEGYEIIDENYNNNQVVMV